MKSGPERLIVFVKAPRPGLVKTRLAASLGASVATLAYQTLVATLLRSLREIRDVELRFTPDDALGDVQPWLQPGWNARSQGDGDLGQRLDRAFAEAFQKRAEKVVVIGSDCPTVTPKDIRDAWAALPRHDLVIGPATDGGYWLIGLRKHEPSLFRNISWSTNTVLQETLCRARNAKLSLHLLRELQDIDTEEDWLAFTKSEGLAQPVTANRP